MTENDLTEAEVEMSDRIGGAIIDAIDAGVEMESISACLQAHQAHLGLAAASHGVEQGLIEEDEIPSELRELRELDVVDGGEA